MGSRTLRYTKTVVLSRSLLSAGMPPITLNESDGDATIRQVSVFADGVIQNTDLALVRHIFVAGTLTDDPVYPTEQSDPEAPAKVVESTFDEFDSYWRRGMHFDEP